MAKKRQANGKPKQKKSSGGGWTKIIMVPVVAVVVAAICFPGDLLTGISSNNQLHSLQIQAGLLAFCMSGTPQALLERERNAVGGDFKFTDDGDIDNEEYTKASIYALLYSMYDATGIVKSEHDVKYQFTFNTWGIAPSRFDAKTEPQRHGKETYAKLFDFEAFKEYKKNNNNKPLKIMEIGCGTGAGANLLSSMVECNYTAIDMQKAAINTCQKLHASQNDRLNCLHVPGGVGVDNKLPAEDNSHDVIIITETHIADIEIGSEEKAIFEEIKRVLKPNGLFLWANALPTRVWTVAMDHLADNGFEDCGSLNHTKGAVVARDEDEQRVNAYTDQLFAQYVAFQVPGYGETCQHVSDRLLKNFYRHPGTALYLKMVTGYDSYMHLCRRNLP